MVIRLLTAIASADWSYAPGDIIDLEEAFAKRLIATGQAEIPSDDEELEDIPIVQSPAEKAKAKAAAEKAAADKIAADRIAADNKAKVAIERAKAKAAADKAAAEKAVAEEKKK